MLCGVANLILSYQLLDLYESPSTSGTHPAIKSCIVHPPLLINLTTTEKKLAKLFQKQLETLGMMDHELQALYSFLLSFIIIGVSLKFDGDNSVGVASIPSVLIEREVNEVRRGRPSVALELVQVSNSWSIAILAISFIYLCNYTAGNDNKTLGGNDFTISITGDIN